MRDEQLPHKLQKEIIMLGAIIGDIVGSRFEFNNTHRSDFELFHKDCSFTDDTICTVAIADAILRKCSYQESLLRCCRSYPNPMGGYGGRFAQWIHSNNPQPYNSFGNGSAMRVSPVAWAFDNLDDVLAEAEKTASPTHNHPEGIKGAKAVAHAIWILRNGGTNVDLSNILHDYYPNFSLDNLQRGKFDETCMGTVTLALYMVCMAESFEDAIRNAVAWGGDSDTIAAIVGSIAEARWGVPWLFGEKAMSYLPKSMQSVIHLIYTGI